MINQDFPRRDLYSAGRFSALTSKKDAGDTDPALPVETYTLDPKVAQTMRDNLIQGIADLPKRWDNVTLKMEQGTKNDLTDEQKSVLQNAGVTISYFQHEPVEHTKMLIIDRDVAAHEKGHDIWGGMRIGESFERDGQLFADDPLKWSSNISEGYSGPESSWQDIKVDRPSLNDLQQRAEALIKSMPRAHFENGALTDRSAT